MKVSRTRSFFLTLKPFELLGRDERAKWNGMYTQTQNEYLSCDYKSIRQKPKVFLGKVRDCSVLVIFLSFLFVLCYLLCGRGILTGIVDSAAGESAVGGGGGTGYSSR